MNSLFFSYHFQWSLNILLGQMDSLNVINRIIDRIKYLIKIFYSSRIWNHGENYLGRKKEPIIQVSFVWIFPAKTLQKFCSNSNYFVCFSLFFFSFQFGYIYPVDLQSICGLSAYKLKTKNAKNCKCKKILGWISLSTSYFVHDI